MSEFAVPENIKKSARKKPRRPFSGEGRVGAEDEAALAVFNAPTIEALNSRVERIEKAYRATHGYKPSPSLQFDVTRAPVHDLDGLFQRPLSGQEKAAREGIAALPEEQQQGLRSGAYDLFPGQEEAGHLTEQGRAHRLKQDLEDRSRRITEDYQQRRVDKWLEQEGNRRYNEYSLDEDDFAADELLARHVVGFLIPPGEPGHVPVKPRAILDTKAMLGRARVRALLADMAAHAEDFAQVMFSAATLGVNPKDLDDELMQSVIDTDDPAVVAELLGLHGEEELLLPGDVSEISYASGLLEPPGIVGKTLRQSFETVIQAPVGVGMVTYLFGNDAFRSIAYDDHSWSGAKDFSVGMKDLAVDIYKNPSDHTVDITFLLIGGGSGLAALGAKGGSVYKAAAGAVRDVTAVDAAKAAAARAAVASGESGVGVVWVQRGATGNFVVKTSAAAAAARRQLFNRVDPGYMIWAGQVKNFHGNAVIRGAQKVRWQGILGNSLPGTPLRRQRNAEARSRERTFEPDDAGQVTGVYRPVPPDAKKANRSTLELRRARRDARKEALLQRDQLSVPVQILAKHLGRAEKAQRVSDSILERALKNPRDFEIFSAEVMDRLGFDLPGGAWLSTGNVPGAAAPRLPTARKGVVPFSKAERRLGNATLIRVAAYGFGRTERQLLAGIEDLERFALILIRDAEDLIAYGIDQPLAQFIAGHQADLVALQAARTQLATGNFQDIQLMIHAANQVSDATTRAKLQIGFLDSGEQAAMRAGKPGQFVDIVLRGEAASPVVPTTTAGKKADIDAPEAEIEPRALAAEEQMFRDLIAPSAATTAIPQGGSIAKNRDVQRYESKQVGGPIGQSGRADEVAAFKASPIYPEYQQAVVAALEKHYTDGKIPVFRAMSPDELARWKAGEAAGTSSWSLSRESAQGYLSTGQNFVLHEMVIDVKKNPEVVFSRSASAAKELVLDTGRIKLEDVSVIVEPRAPIFDAIALFDDNPSIGLTYGDDRFPSQLPNNTRGDPTQWVLTPRDPFGPEGNSFYFNPQRVKDKSGSSGSFERTGKRPDEAMFEPDVSQMMGPMKEYKATTMLYGDTRIDVPELLIEDYVKVMRAQGILGEHAGALSLLGTPHASESYVEGWQPVLRDTRKNTDPDVKAALDQMENERYVGNDHMGLFNDETTESMRKALFPNRGDVAGADVVYVNPLAMLLNERLAENAVKTAFEYKFKVPFTSASVTGRDVLQLINSPIRDLTIYARVGYAANWSAAQVLGLITDGFAHPRNYARAVHMKRTYGPLTTGNVDAMHGFGGKSLSYFTETAPDAATFVKRVAEPGRRLSRGWNVVADLHARRAMANAQLKRQGIILDIPEHRDAFNAAALMNRNSPEASESAGITLTQGAMAGKLLTKGDVKNIIISASARTKRAALEFDDLGPYQKALIQNAWFLFAFERAGVKYTLNSMFDYPVKWAVGYELGALSEEYVDAILGVELPEWMNRVPYFPVGINGNGEQELINLASQHIWGVGAEFGLFGVDMLDWGGGGMRRGFEGLLGKGHPVPAGIVGGIRGGFKETIVGIGEEVGRKLPQIQTFNRFSRMAQQRLEDEEDAAGGRGVPLSYSRGEITEQEWRSERSFFQVDSWLQALQPLIGSSSLYPTAVDEEVGIAQFNTESNDPETRLERDMKLIRQRNDDQAKILRRPVPPRVREGLEFVEGISVALAEWAKDKPSVSPGTDDGAMKAQFYIDFAFDNGFIDEEEERELSKLRLAAGPDEDESWGDIKELVMVAAGSNEVLQWQADVHHVERFRGTQRDGSNGVMPRAVESLVGVELTSREVGESMLSASESVRDEYGRGWLAWYEEHTSYELSEDDPTEWIILKTESDDETAKREAEHRDFLDRADEERVIRGHTFASPERVQWAIRTEGERDKFANGLLNDNWAGLSRFRKELLGVRLSPETQREWRSYEAGIEVLKELRAKAGKDVTDRDRLKLTKISSDEFKQDWAFSRQFRFDRFKKLRLFKKHREDWEGFLSFDGSNMMELAESISEKLKKPSSTATKDKLKELWLSYVDNEVGPALRERAVRGDLSVVPLLDAGGSEFLEGWFSA